jgi:hypothetical protein
MISWLHCFGAYGKVEYHDAEHVVEQSFSPDGIWETKKREQKIEREQQRDR